MCRCMFIVLMFVYCVCVVSAIILYKPPMFKVPEAPQKPIPEEKIPPSKGIIPLESVKCMSSVYSE